MLKSYKYRPSGVSDFFFCDSERSLNWWAPEGFICINICINITLLENPDSASIKELNTKVYALKFKCDVPSIANKICIHVCVVCNLFRPCWSAWMSKKAWGVRWLAVHFLFLWVYVSAKAHESAGERASWQVYLFGLAPGCDLGSLFGLFSVKPNPLINPLNCPSPFFSPLKQLHFRPSVSPTW